jgi:hypothetical protein
VIDNIRHFDLSKKWAVFISAAAGRFGSGHRGGVSCTTRPPSRSIKDRRIRLIEKFRNSTTLGIDGHA